MANGGRAVKAVVPLESNPLVFTQFAQQLGLSPVFGFTDIYSISDPDLISFLPRPIQAVILLFPISKQYEQLKTSEEQNRTTALPEHEDAAGKAEATAKLSLYINENNTIWLKQVVKNACGLYALLHALLNIPAGLITPDSIVSNLKKALTISDDADPATLIEQVSDSMYSGFSEQGQTKAPEATEDIDLHFICFVKTEAGVVELDGRREGPVVLNSNKSDSDILDEQSVKDRIECYMRLAESDNALNFALMGLAPNCE